MSVNVPLDELPQALERFGPNPYNEQVALLWPAPAPGEHALIVDGWAAVFDSPETNEVVFIQPGKAVLHVSKG